MYVGVWEYVVCFSNFLEVNGTISRYIDNDNDYFDQLILQRVVIWSFWIYVCILNRFIFISFSISLFFGNTCVGTVRNGIIDET